MAMPCEGSTHAHGIVVGPWLGSVAAGRCDKSEAHWDEVEGGSQGGEDPGEAMNLTSQSSGTELSCCFHE